MVDPTSSCKHSRTHEGDPSASSNLGQSTPHFGQVGVQPNLKQCALWFVGQLLATEVQNPHHGISLQQGTRHEAWELRILPPQTYILPAMTPPRPRHAETMKADRLDGFMRGPRHAPAQVYCRASVMGGSTCQKTQRLSPSRLGPHRRSLKAEC